MTQLGRIQLGSSHFYLDEFQCGGRFRNRGFHPDGCPYCGGAVILQPWLFHPLNSVREFRDVPFRIKSGYRCLDYNRDVWAIILFNKVYGHCSTAEQAEVREHDDSRHRKDAVDVEPQTDDLNLKQEIYDDLGRVFRKHGYFYVAEDLSFAHCDVREITKARLGV